MPSRPVGTKNAKDEIMGKAAMRNMVIGIMIFAFIMGEISQGNQSVTTLSEVSVAGNGTLVRRTPVEDCQAYSDNARYWCRYEVGNVGDEMRELVDFRFFEDGKLLYSMTSTPGSDVMISNAGIGVFFDHSRHFEQELTNHFYSKVGRHLYSETFKGAFVFGFSATGNLLGVGTPDGLFVIDAANQRTVRYEKGFQFDISEDEDWVAVAAKDLVKVYRAGKLKMVVNTGFQYTRKVQISTELQVVAAIDKRNLKVFSLADGALLFEKILNGDLSYRDLVIQEGKVLAGVHYRDGVVSKGILTTYSPDGVPLSEQEGETKQIPIPPTPTRPIRQSDSRQNPIPWPFVPFDSMHTVWNYYEQHMGDGVSDWSYLHQGLDIIVPIDEPTYAVEAGIVKCVLTLGGPIYWRLAISPEQSSGWSDGWLYAHLVRQSIQVEVGDTVEVHDYLGDIIEWTPDWGHIHFVEIHDSGTVWQYEDNEWGINFNPLLALEPDSDWVAPDIRNVFPYSKFGFCRNETSTYLQPDSLYGEIDIIVRVVDYIGDSEWQQPAFCSYYWVNQLPEDSTVFPRTLGYVLNHRYSFYETTHYEPYAVVLYKRDELLLAPSWMDSVRNFYHILTNNNGDSLIELSEADSAFDTEDYPDGDYRIFVEVFDEYGNSALDSMNVRFRNGNYVSNSSFAIPYDIHLEQNHPNPFNSTTVIRYAIPRSSMVTLAVYDILGRKVQVLVDGLKVAGRYSAVFDVGKLGSGVYFYQLKAGDFVSTKKMVYLR